MSNLLYSLFPELEESLKNSLGNFLNLLETVFDIIFILVVAKAAIAVGKKLIKSAIKGYIRKSKRADERKLNTLLTVFKSLWRYLIWFFAAAAVIDRLGLGITAGSILATAGIGGLAIGFGAQNLVKDVISGCFLLFENQIAVGDYVTLMDKTGTIEEIQLRITKVRSFTGELHIIPNGQISVVTNLSRGTNTALVDVPIEYEQNISQAIDIIESTVREYAAASELLAGDPQVVGPLSFDSSAIMLRVICPCKTMQHFTVALQLRRAILDAFNANQISIPYNKIVILGDRQGDNKKC